MVVGFSPLKIGSFFSCKNSIPKSLQSYVVYQLTCAGCNAYYIGETKRHLKTINEEHLGKEKNLKILKHLQENPLCRQVNNFDCFDGIDHDNSNFRLQLQEAMHITWKMPILSKQIKHVTVTLTSAQVSLFFHFLPLFYSFLQFFCSNYFSFLQLILLFRF